MTDPSEGDIEERLRAALRAEADSVHPSPDALNQIRARTARNRLGWLSGLPWLRPALAVGAALVIAGSVLLGTPQVREQVLPTLSSSSGTHPSAPDDDHDDPASEGQDTREPDPGKGDHQEDGGQESPAPTTAPTEDDSDGGKNMTLCGGKVPTRPDGSPSPGVRGNSRDGYDTNGDGEVDCKPSDDPSGDPGDGDGDNQGPGDGDGDNPGPSPGDGSDPGPGPGDGGSGQPNNDHQVD